MKIVESEVNVKGDHLTTVDTGMDARGSLPSRVLVDEHILYSSEKKTLTAWC